GEVNAPARSSRLLLRPFGVSRVDKRADNGRRTGLARRRRRFEPLKAPLTVAVQAWSTSAAASSARAASRFAAEHFVLAPRQGCNRTGHGPAVAGEIRVSYLMDTDGLLERVHQQHEQWRRDRDQDRLASM